jgi:hypothetical protein
MGDLRGKMPIRLLILSGYMMGAEKQNTFNSRITFVQEECWGFGGAKIQSKEAN